MMFACPETTDGRTLFFLFKRTTNKTQTYQAGRMLNTPLPANGIVDLNFNRSYTPPCASPPTPVVRCRPKKTACLSPSKPASCATRTLIFLSPMRRFRGAGFRACRVGFRADFL
jgi:hypothetical protein